MSDDVDVGLAEGEREERVAQLESELQVALDQNRALDRKLKNARREVTAHKEFERQIFHSRSWRLTAPLRGLSVLFGAPPAPMLPDKASVAVEAQPRADDWNSLIPLDTPPEMLVRSPDQAARNNNRCEIVLPDRTLLGMVPESLLESYSIAPGVPTCFGASTVSGAIAFIGSEELAVELSFDAQVTVLDESSWSDVLRNAELDFLLIEPVWHVGNRHWRNAMHGEGAARPGFEALLRAARERGLPIVAWYRMSPEDVPAFAWIGRHADAVYAIDEASRQMVSEQGGVQVEVLPPAVQPKLHNPFRSWEQLTAPSYQDRVLFDGWLDLLEGAANEPVIVDTKSDRLLVCESEWEFGGVRLEDVPEFKRNALGCLGAVGKIAVSRMVGVEVFRSSPLVPDWRRGLMMLRSSACGAVAIGPGADDWGGGHRQLDVAPGELAPLVRGTLAAPLARDRIKQVAIREILSRHCLSDRLDAMCGRLGLERRFSPPGADIACLLVTMRPELLEACIDRFRADIYPHKELVIVLHGHDAPLEHARSLVREGERISVYRLGKQHSLGACLNFAAAQTGAAYWAKIDDDDVYGPNYLSDIMLYRRAVDFAAGGKPAAFIYSQADDEFRWDEQYARQRAWQFRRPGRGERIHIAGGTLVGKRSVLEELPFSVVRRKGSDSDFLRRLDAAEHPFVAFDYFNFALFRSGTPGFHTWNADLEAFKQRTVALGAWSEKDSVVTI